jgi:hypothetical protein
MDNLYLDMNGIIHNCTHANDPNLKLTETEMVIRIFSYLDKLIHIMKPRKLVFMAIDGELSSCYILNRHVCCSRVRCTASALQHVGCLRLQSGGGRLLLWRSTAQRRLQCTVHCA